MITIKTKEEIEILRAGGKRLAEIVRVLARAVAPGVSARDLNSLAEKMVNEGGDASAFLHYKPYGAKRGFPAVLCVSVNDEVVHGIPNETEKIFREGDIVSIDMGLVHKKMYTDMAVTVPVGKVSHEKAKLLEVTADALSVGIAAARAGVRVGAISHAIEAFILPYKFGIVRELAGHGVGYAVHEDPYVPNYGSPDEGPLLKAGMVIAIEPMVNLGTRHVKLAPDGYTYITSDGKPSAHFEKTIVITEDGPEVLTQ